VVLAEAEPILDNSEVLAMSRTLEVCLDFGLLLTWDVKAGPAQPRIPANSIQPGLTIQIKNDAQVAGGTLSRALAEAGRLLSEAGVPALWRDCSAGESGRGCACDEKPGPTVLEVSIAYRSGRFGHGADLFGLALPFEGGGVRATIYFDRIIRAAKSGLVSPGVLLGHVIAHEVGHLLLWSNGHSREGIMRGSWTTADLLKLAQGRERFTPEQAESMRANLRLRLEQKRVLGCQSE
jgi:hypothetical protein